MVKERDYNLDLIRFIAILGVVAIHISNYYCRFFDNLMSVSYFFASFYNGISRISVPLFFMISGALLLAKPPKDEKIKKKVKHFIFILIAWTVIYLVFDILYMGYSFSLTDIAGALFTPLKPHLWFMYAIIALYIIAPFASILIEHMGEHYENLFLTLWITATGGVTLLRIILEFFYVNTEITYPIPLVQATYYLGYFLAGSILYRRVRSGRIPFANYLRPAFIISILVGPLGTFILSNIKGRYFEKFLQYRGIFVLIASLSAFILLLQCPLKKEKTRRMLGAASPNLFGVYLLHLIFFDLLIRTVSIMKLNALYGIPLCLIGVFGITYLAVYLLKRVPYVKNLF